MEVQGGGGGPEAKSKAGSDKCNGNSKSSSMTASISRLHTSDAVGSDRDLNLASGTGSSDVKHDADEERRDGARPDSRCGVLRNGVRTIRVGGRHRSHNHQDVDADGIHRGGRWQGARIGGYRGP